MRNFLEPIIYWAMCGWLCAQVVVLGLVIHSAVFK